MATKSDKPIRYAVIPNGNPERIAAYLPTNYKVVGYYNADSVYSGVVVIAGRDHAGWTLDDYVIPRLASGLAFATELVVKE